MSHKIAMALLIAVGVGAASSASAAVSAPWPPTNVQKTQAVPEYGYAISKGNRQRMNHAPQIGEAHGSGEGRYLDTIGLSAWRRTVSPTASFRCLHSVLGI